MIKKIRIKFIALSAFSLLLVLAIIIGSINLINYREVVRDADLVLSILAENRGTFPQMEDVHRDARGGLGPMSPELPYESRYFSVRIDSSGNIIAADTSKITAADTADAIDYAQTVLNSGKTTGFLLDYRYLKMVQNGETQIIFLDCGRNLNTFRTFLLSSLGISLLSLLAVLCLIILLSGRIVKPFSESYEKQKRFITDAGHEIKTPLAIITADTDVLEMDLGENEWLQDIQKQTVRLTDLTNSLICLSRIEEGANQFQMIELPFSDLVSETAQSFQALAKTQNKAFTLNIQPLLSLRGDEKALSRLVSILLDNALKYSEESGSISLTLEKQGKSIRLSVYNTTPSISRESLSRLFDRFYRADSSRNSNTGGYGIGLSIAQAVAAAHKAKITASTQDEKSLLITVLFPA